MRARVKVIDRPMSRKAVLDVLEAKLKETLRHSADRKELEIDYQADPVDQVCSGMDREMTVKRLTQRSQLIQDLHSAIERIHSEEFGICEQCEQPISQQRLHAIPWARLCVKCQSQMEARAQESIHLNHAA
jgi:RNA polymerase-binding transcription factor